MTAGPGKYDDLCTIARKGSKARGAVLIILAGKHGSGFSVQADEEMTMELPALLRELAAALEKDVIRMRQ